MPNGRPETHRRNRSSKWILFFTGCSPVLTFGRDAFEDAEAIYIPDDDDSSASWVPPSQCLWEGPPYLSTVYSLRTQYQDLCHNMDVELNNVERLFCDVLEIKNCKTEDLVEELESLQNKDQLDLDNIIQLYEYLRDLIPDMSNGERKELR